MSQDQVSEHNADSPEAKSSPASLHSPSPPTPEQLREAIKALFDRADTAKVCNIDGFTEETLALFANFLASIELPEKRDVALPRSEHLQLQLANNRGANEAIDQSQSIIDRLVQEFKG